MLFTPEMSGLLDRDSARAAKNLEHEEEDGSLPPAAKPRRRHRIWLHLGSLAVLAENGKVANRSFVIDREGQIRARYDKLHLFDVDLPTGESWRESNVYSAGQGVVLVNGTPVGKLGLTICYDLRFPGLFARLAEAGRGRDRCSGSLHSAHRQGALARSSCARARSRRVCSWSPRRRWAARGWPQDLRPLARRRSLGRGSARHGRGAGGRVSPTSISSAFPMCARAYPRSITAGPSRTR